MNNYNLEIKQSSLLFTSNPTNLHFLYNFPFLAFSFLHDNQFEIFNTNKDNNIYLIYNDYKTLICYDILSKKIIKILKEIHEDDILSFRHYLKNKSDLLITSSRDNSIKLFDISNDWKNILKIENVGDNNDDEYFPINSVCLLSYNNIDYIVSSCNLDSYLKIFNLDGKKVKNFGDKIERVNYINYYYDKNNNTCYIITLSNEVNSFLFESGKLYKNYYISEESFIDNYVISEKNNKINLIFSSKNQILCFDFIKGDLLYQINLNDDYWLHCICLWNEEYIISGGNDNLVHIINLKEKKEELILKGHNNIVYTIKKIKLNEKECLLTHEWGGGKIIMWSN